MVHSIPVPGTPVPGTPYRMCVGEAQPAREATTLLTYDEGSCIACQDKLLRRELWFLIVQYNIISE
jgi:hypothetical protein